MKIEYNKKSNITVYDDTDVIKAIQFENEGHRVFKFDSNLNQINFFEYFLNKFRVEKKSESNIVENYLSRIISAMPKTIDDCVKTGMSLLDIDCNTRAQFKKMRPEIITAFIFNKMAPLLFDELYLFYDKSPLYKLSKDIGTETIQDFVYEVVIAISHKIKRKKLNCEPEVDPIIIYKSEDFEQMKIIPQTLSDAIDMLITSLENDSKYYESINFNKIKSLDVLNCLMFDSVYNIIYTAWYLDYSDSPLRKWFRKNKKMDDPFQVCYYIIRVFSSTLMLKKS